MVREREKSEKQKSEGCYLTRAVTLKIEQLRKVYLANQGIIHFLAQALIAQRRGYLKE